MFSPRRKHKLRSYMNDCNGIRSGLFKNRVSNVTILKQRLIVKTSFHFYDACFRNHVASRGFVGSRGSYCRRVLDRPGSINRSPAKPCDANRAHIHNVVGSRQSICGFFERGWRCHLLILAKRNQCGSRPRNSYRAQNRKTRPNDGVWAIISVASSLQSASAATGGAKFGHESRWRRRSDRGHYKNST